MQQLPTRQAEITLPFHAVMDFQPSAWGGAGRWLLTEKVLAGHALWTLHLLLKNVTWERIACICPVPSQLVA